MATNMRGERRGSPWTLLAWGGAAALLALPAVAMRFTDEVRWTATDFATFGAMLVLACGGLELAVRASRSRAYRSGAAIAIGAAFLLVWITLAVGFIGDEGNAANLMFGGVLAVGIAGAYVARGRAPGLVRALVATAAAQGLVGALAVAFWGVGPIETTASVVFVALWLGSAALFRLAASDGP